MKPKTYYHFTGPTLRNEMPIPPIGAWLEFGGKLEPCKSGLHASEKVWDALGYAPGNLLHRVELGNQIIPHGEPVDKVVSNRRKIIASINAERLLRDFARRCALDVLYLWPDAPKVVVEYLKTGNESIRGAARGAAWDAARDARIKTYIGWLEAAVDSEFKKGK